MFTFFVSTVTGILCLILGAFFQRWLKATGKIQVTVELKSFKYDGPQFDFHKFPKCDPSDAESAEYSLTLFVFSYKEAPTAFRSLKVFFRKGGKVVLQRNVRNAADNSDVAHLELPSRIPVSIVLTDLTDSKSPETKLIAQSDAMYLETVTVEGQRKEYLIARINQPDPPTPDKGQ